MLSSTIERINHLRKQAIQDPKFLKSAKAHENAIKKDSRSIAHPGTRKRKSKPRKEAEQLQLI